MNEQAAPPKKEAAPAEMEADLAEDCSRKARVARTCISSSGISLVFEQEVCGIGSMVVSRVVD